MSAAVRFLFSLGLVAGFSAPALAVPAMVPLVSHMAVYDIKLVTAKPDSGVADVSGRLVVEVKGSACDGWSVGFRMINRFVNSEGDEPRLVDLQSTSWESDDGSALRYSQREYLNNTLDSELRLTAEHPSSDTAVRVRFSDDEPEAELPKDVVFPMEHQRRVIGAARERRSHDRSIVYDGSEGAKYYTAVTFIGPEMELGTGLLAGVRSWPMTISYFEAEPKADGERLASHTVSMRLYENGISSDLILDYGDLKLAGNLAKIEMRQSPACD